MKIKSTEFYTLIFFMIQSCLCGFIINDTIRLVENNAWIVPIIGTLAGFIILKMYLFIFKQNENINKLNFKIFGNKLGKLFNILITLFIIFFMNTLFLVLINFISTQYLYDTPPNFIIILIIFTIMYVLHNKSNSLFRTALILFYIMLIIYLFTTIGLVNQINFKNLMPWFNFKSSNLLKSIFDYIAYTTTPLFIMTTYKKNNIENVNDKKIIITYFLSNLVVFLIVFVIISVFGINLCNLYQFPGYHILKRAFEGAVIERLEKILAIYWILSMLIPIIFWSNSILDNLKQNFKIKKFSYLILIIILFVNSFLLSNISIIKIWNEQIFPIVMNISILIPIIITIRLKKISKN